MNKEYVAQGMWFRSYPGHGYLVISDERLRQMEEKHPELLITCQFYYGGNYFEEDSEWARVVLAFPECFSFYTLKWAIRTMRNEHPDIYEKFSGRIIPLKYSSRKRKREFLEKHKKDYIVTSARGDWYELCPDGFVLAYASVGGNQTDMRVFIVPEEEYNAPREFWFVIDLSKHKEVE